MALKLAGQLAQDLGLPLASLLIRSACGEVAGTVGQGLLQIAEQLAGDCFEQKELARHFERIGEKRRNSLPWFSATNTLGNASRACRR